MPVSLQLDNISIFGIGIYAILISLETTLVMFGHSSVGPVEIARVSPEVGPKDHYEMCQTRRAVFASTESWNVASFTVSTTKVTREDMHSSASTAHNYVQPNSLRVPRA
jgi:hypothetical protein